MATVDVERLYPSVDAGQPDIGYAPNYDKYLARVQKRLASEELKRSLPPEFPAKLDSALVWNGKDIENDTDWLYHLSPEDLEEIEEGLQHFQG